MRFWWAALAVMLSGAALAQTSPWIDFPTANHALIQGHPEEFFMYVDRDFEGQKSKPWQGGQFGYVRGPRRTSKGIIYRTIHEGIDIRPVRRDSQGNPLDQVEAAAAGRVVYVNLLAGASNYGRYVVLEHMWNGSPYYTLYAHLSKPLVAVEDQVAQGQPIGVMGFTGSGIDRTRAHVHFEVCLMMSDNFDTWHNTVFAGNPNPHGLYNGLNLAGCDPARLLLAVRQNPELKISDFLQADEPAFRVTVKSSPHLSLIRKYPWLVPAGEVADPPAWTITFSRHAMPIKVVASDKTITAPVLEWARDGGTGYADATRGMVAGASGSPHLTESGVRFARLLTWPD